MLLTEVVKSFLKPVERNLDNYSSAVQPNSMLHDLTDPELTFKAGSFFDTLYDNFNRNLYTDADFASLLQAQADKIDQYRQIATDSDVSNAIDEIVNEIIFTYDQKFPIKLSCNLENDKLKDAIQKCFDEIIKIANLSRNFEKIVRDSYIDGQLVFHLSYDKKDQKRGIRKIQLIDPKYFFYDAKDNKYKYSDAYQFNTLSLYQVDRFPQIFDQEEIVRTDFGLHFNGLNYSYLEYALKTANMLKTLEDLLVPLRFSRSVSRRVFNVDVGNMPTKRADEYIRALRDKFKYKKFYNSQTGEITNQQHIVSMVEDYWFPNRSGSKGTTVDLLNETEGLGELDDILYFAKKLYRSMNVPCSRIDYDPNNNDPGFSFTTDTISREEARFFAFTSRLRIIYTEFLKEVLKRQVISTGVMTEKEWDNNCDNINLEFINVNVFIDKMKNALFNEKLEYYHNVQNDATKIFSIRTILKDIFRFTDEEIDKEFENIEAEKNDKRFASFYQENEY